MMVYGVFAFCSLLVHVTVQSQYEEQLRLVLESKGDNPMVNHTIFPDTRVIQFSPIFDKKFLQKVYRLKRDVETIKSRGLSTVTLNDICVKGRGRCVVESVWSYFQDSIPHLYKEAWDEFHFFKTADYLDHLLACFRSPWSSNDGLLNMSCIPDNGYTTIPEHTLSHFPTAPDMLYRNASRLLITLHVKATARWTPQVTTWLHALQDYVTSVVPSAHPDIDVTLDVPYTLTNRPG